MTAGAVAGAGVSEGRSRPVRSRRGPGLRLRLTLLATGLVAAVAALLLWLGWLLVGSVVAAVPALPAGTVVTVRGVAVDPAGLAGALRDAARDDVLRAGAVAFALVVLATAIVAWVLTGQVLRPLQEVTAAARRLSAESLAERIALRGPRDEVRELADTFDAMLERLQAGFEGQRRFVANASHELRTPLAVMRTEVDVTLADPDADVAELRRMAAVVREATERADRLVDGLLLLARAESVSAASSVALREPVDLAQLVAGAWRAVRAEAEAMHLSMVVTGGPAATLGDTALLERVAGNLVENAVRHNVPGGWVELHTESGPTGAVLRVTASGAVVAPERVTEFFEPFRRGTVDRTGRGAGLGLSIVRAVVRAHDGRIDAQPVPSGGLSVEVHLPTPPSPS
jgi:hypothetical protein